MSLHPEVEKMIEAGKIESAPYADGQVDIETDEEFARRIAALAVEKERESVGRAPIYTDRSSIVNAFLKAHPDVTKADGFHNHSNSGPFFWIADLSRTEDGKPATIERDDERWNYYGLEVGVARWVVQR